MDDTIKIRGGKGETPELQDRELGYNRDEKALYIGTPENNVRLCGADDIANVKKYMNELMVAVNARLAALESLEATEEGEENG